MKLNINPFNSENPMSLGDAAKVAAATALVVWILTFLANATLGQIKADPVEFCFNAVVSYLVTFAGNFAGLAGLKYYTNRQKEGGETPG